MRGQKGPHPAGNVPSGPPKILNQGWSVPGFSRVHHSRSPLSPVGERGASQPSHKTAPRRAVLPFKELRSLDIRD